MVLCNITRVCYCVLSIVSDMFQHNSFIMEAMIDIIDTFSFARNVTGSGSPPPDEPWLDALSVTRRLTRVD